MDREDIEFLKSIRPEIQRVFESYPNREVARRFAISYMPDRASLPPGTILKKTVSRKIVPNNGHVAFGGCYCCEVDPETWECIGMCCDKPDWHSKVLIGLGAAAVALLADKMLRR
jgi:hypothetical protein